MQIKPIDPILRLPAVITATGMSRSSIYRFMSEGTFPKSIRLSKRACGWRQSQIEAWVEARAMEGV